MNLNRINNRGFTLSEVMIAVAISSVILGAILTASIALQKSFNAVDNYFAAHVQQIRIVDYLSRDVKRSYIVTTSGSPQTVTCTIPNYIIQSGDSDAGSGVGTRRKPNVTIKSNPNGTILLSFVNYGPTRTAADGVTANASATLTSATAAFTAADVGQTLAGGGIPSGTTIQSYTNSTTVTMSNNATATAGGVTVTIGPQSSVVYSINNQSIRRTENGVLTTIASSTDNLLPTSVLSNILLTNTEYLSTSITFLPIFTSGGATAERSGTTIYSTAYLRNKRRG